MKRIAVLVLLLVAVATTSYAQCNTPSFPAPRVKYLSKTVEPTFIRYWFEVYNRASYDNALFVASPNLPPCGLNTSASRTWLNIFRTAGPRIYGYCALSNNTQLAKLWFAIPKNDPQPKSFYITMTDRKCKREVKSAPVPIP
jgi:hypothetical protein